MIQNRWVSLLSLSALGVSALTGCERTPPPAEAPVAAPEAQKLPAPKPMTAEQLAHFFKPLPMRKDAPPPPEDTDAQVTLGRMLYFEPRLSKNHDVSCNTCHGLTTFGVDNKALSDGHKGLKGTRNSPTVYNAGGHIAQFWDGRVDTLEAQATGPILNPVEMAMPDEKRVVATLTSIPEYTKRFREAFPGDKKPVTMANAARAIAAFERKLVTTSRFDSFVGGKHDALTEQEQRGLQLFATTGCTTCHNGPAVGGTSFQKLGLIEDYPGLKDAGRFDATKNEDDRGKFRVPTLLNVDKTGPYLHDGSVVELPQMVRLMAKHQLARTLTDPEVDDLVAFLKSLTGELPPAEFIAPPQLPPSTAKTPKPDPS
ncbi:cytochrome-c peroxidase [Myxococcus xanthus]|uniref:cytochrome-c peroxidase n=1 Tax=Myxococcus xanthus TaxID=34 RepID=UPI0011263E3C|nr:cytochrome c peroxidase [Myxococcus xanthus]QDE85134.1 cytochrome-c peroxidase [Myxococcus xanthus]QDE99293.1 cytochrome-c peroxidase [Myxococcus xanthus]QDF06991.1 cytochrome-c peroxidase [Myxococcus xanthus]